MILSVIALSGASGISWQEEREGRGGEERERRIERERVKYI